MIFLLIYPKTFTLAFKGIEVFLHGSFVIFKLTENKYIFSHFNCIIKQSDTLKAKTLT